MQPVVATLTLDGDWSNDDESDEDDEDYPENEFGMNSFREYMSDEYMDKMNALSRKYDEDPRETFIPSDSKGKAPMARHNPHKVACEREQNTAKQPRGVRFAESLDIAQPPVQEKPSLEVAPPAEAKPEPLSEIVQERSNTKPQNVTMPRPFQKLSKFKAARMAADVVAQREP